MRVIRRLDVINNQSWLTDDNLGTDATAEWASGTGYTAGDEVKVTSTAAAATATYKIYEALQGTTGNDPTTDVGTVSPGVGTYWKEIGSVNEWALFNDVAQDQSTKSGGFFVEVTSGENVTGVAVFNINASDFDILVTDPTEGVVHNENYSMNENVGVDSWYEFFFDPIIRNRNYAVLDLPPYMDAAVKVTFNGTGDVSVGALVMGSTLTVGRTLKGASISLVDYSRAEYIPDLGRVIFDQRDYAEGGDFDVLMPVSQLAYVRQELVDLRSRGLAWIANEDVQGTALFGYLKDMDIVLATDQDYLVNIEIEGMT